MFLRLIMFRKRGISPLIATVLLIAFAVAIGTMLITVFKDNLIPRSGDCSQVEIALQNINNEPLFCYDTLTNKINFMVKNTGDADIDKLRLVITGSDFSHEELDIDQTALKSGAFMTKTVDYVKAGTFKAEIVPVMKYGGEEKACLNRSISVESIQKCNR
jgi:flagellin-like protein